MSNHNFSMQIAIGSQDKTSSDKQRGLGLLELLGCHCQCQIPVCGN